MVSKRAALGRTAGVLTRAGAHGRSEDGAALVVAIFTTMLVLLVTGVLLSQATATSDSASKDRDTKAAVQAANAGLDVAFSRLNKLPPPDPTTLPCLTSLGTFIAALNGWCDAISGQLADGASYRYQVQAPQLLGDRWVVSSGTVDGVTRRVAAKVAPGNVPIFGDFAVRSRDTLIADQQVRVDGHVASNGDIDLRGQPPLQAVVCGNATPGPGGRVIAYDLSSSVCPEYSSAQAETQFTLPPVPPPTSVDGNARLCRTTEPRDVCGPNVTWNATARTLELGRDTSVTLGGDVYFFCGIRVGQNSQIRISKPAGAPPTKIYIDSPENCGSSSLRGTIRMDQGSTIYNPNPDPSSLQLYVMGSTTTSTTVQLNQSATNVCPVPQYTTAACLPILVYAPNSIIDVDQNVLLIGAIAAKQVVMDQGSRVVYDPNAANVTLPDPTTFGAKDFRECSPAPTGATPNSGC